jgi:hypothetical protein
VQETGERLDLSSIRLRAPIVPKKFFHTAGNFTEHHNELQAVKWSHPVHKGIVFFQNVDATSSGPTRRSSTRRAD